jgi:hypothetical protein
LNYVQISAALAALPHVLVLLESLKVHGAPSKQHFQHTQPIDS